MRRPVPSKLRAGTSCICIASRAFPAFPLHSDLGAFRFRSLPKAQGSTPTGKIEASSNQAVNQNADVFGYVSFDLCSVSSEAQGRWVGMVGCVGLHDAVYDAAMLQNARGTDSVISVSVASKGFAARLSRVG